MPVPPLDDRALEALLSGAPSAQSGFDWLVPFVEDLEAASSRPVPVLRPALVQFLDKGLSTEKGDLPATAASNVTGPAPQAAGLPKWRKKRMIISELLAGLTTKLAGLGMAAKAGLGLTLAAASTTAAGAAGVLPAPAQHAVATVVSSATPFSFPDTANSHASVGAKAATDATDATDATETVDGTVSDATKTATDAPKTVTDAPKTGTGGGGPSSQVENHGTCVSAVAGDKSAAVDGNHGKAVSAVAKSDCGKTTGGDTTSSTTPTTVHTTTTSTAVPGTNGATSSGSSGKGKGNSNAKANSSGNN